MAFLRDLSPADRAEAISKIDKNAFLKRAAARFPGTRVHGLSFDAGLKKGGADFTVRAQQPYVLGGQHPTAVAVPGYKALVRNDNNQPVSIVGSSYGIVQAHEAFAGLRGLCNEGLASLESVWCHDGGRRFGAAALIGTSANLPRLGADKPETFAHYVTVNGGHDGLSSLLWDRYSLQVACLNGATTSTREQRVSVRHSSNATYHVAEAAKALVALVAGAVEEARLLNELGQSRLALAEFIEFADELLSETLAEEPTERSKTIHQNKVVELTELFQRGTGNQGLSKLDAYSAVTEWLTPRLEQYKDAAKFATRFYNDTNASARPAQLRERAVRLLTR